MIPNNVKQAFDITCDVNHPYHNMIGKRVRYKQYVIEKAIAEQLNMIVINTTFIVKETQYNWANIPCVRIYAPGDDFGRCANVGDLDVL